MNKLELVWQKIQNSLENSEQLILDRHKNLVTEVRHLKSRLLAYDPLAALKRGYAVVRGEVKTGSTITVERLKDTITAEVKNVRNK